MSSLFLVPVDEPSYRATLETKANLTDWDNRPADIPERAHVWGVRTDPEQGTWSRNRRNWEKMESGDDLLFYRNGQGHYFATGTVGAMFRTEYVRDNLWNGGPAIDLYTVEEYDESIRLESHVLNDVLGYDSSYYPRGLRRVADHRPTDRLDRRLGD